MELRTVNTFLHIAELHSFSRTARQLGYSQSAVSSQIAQLEAELGTPLFDRVGKTVRLTDAGQTRTHHLEVSCPEALWQTVPEADRAALQGVLASDPRPSYQHDPQRVYGMEFAGLEVHFTVDGDQLTVRDITLL